MIYLAGPYSHPELPVMEERYQKHMAYLAHLLKQGLVVFSPITSWHVVASQYTLPRDWPFWRNLDLTILGRCDKLIVLTIEGWDVSVGTRAEIAFAVEQNIPIEYHQEQ
jgi:nucleoside 2-deoxyribosyltransferase